MNEKTISIVVVVLVVIGGLAFYLSNTPSESNISDAGGVKDTTIPTKPKEAGHTSSPVVTGLIVGSVKSTKLGEYLTDNKGVTLYVSGDDKKLQSSCTGECLKNWPPFVFDNKNIASSTDLLSKRMNVIKRSDGTFQYAYGEKPVYYYVGDKNPGDTNGNGMNGGKWSVVVIK